MKLPLSWLCDFTNIDGITPKEYDARLTMTGSKVEEVYELGAEIQNVVVGQVDALERHPDSDHLWVCQIDVGDATVQICTGAQNLHIGDLVPVAKHKSTLPGGVKITRGKLRGQVSEGMLCSLRELELDTHNLPYAVITPAAVLGDYHALPGKPPSLPAPLCAGHTLFGSTVIAEITALEAIGYNRYRVAVSCGETSDTFETTYSNLHTGDFVAFDTKERHILSPSDLRAQQAEFPHCIADGILVLDEPNAKPGDDIKAVLGLDEWVADFEITSNRPDCMSVIGLARETAATFDRPFSCKTPVVRGGCGTIDGLLSVNVLEPTLCPRYTARLVKNIKIAPSPAWLRQRLHAAGVRPINNLVDITNYVMLEYGQPMHAFDYACLEQGAIVVRTAQADECLQTLDGVPHKLTEQMLVICDQNKPVAVAGVMGGANSEITDHTTTVVFESACFHGASVRVTAKALGMRTEASSRFEKGLDARMTLDAVNRACELVELLGAGEVVDGVIDVDFGSDQPCTLPFEPERMNALLGLSLPADEQARLLGKLGFVVENETVTVPSFRTDIAQMCDLAEEVARMYGYDNIPTTLYAGEMVQGELSPVQKHERTAASLCRHAGFDEAMTHSFISPKLYDLIAMRQDDPRRASVTITNPLGEDFSVMRTTVLPCMLQSLARNYAHRNATASLYELGTIYLPVLHESKVDPTALPHERKVLTLGTYGRLQFFDFKGVIEMLLRELGCKDVRFVAELQNPSYHPGRCARIMAGTQVLGVFGALHPLVCRKVNIPCEVLCAELDLGALFDAQSGEKRYRPLPKYPASTRDLALLVAETVPAASLQTVLERAVGDLLEEVRLFDVYQGKGIAAGKKSLAYSLTLRALDHTLTDEECDKAVTAALKAANDAFGAVLRS